MKYAGLWAHFWCPGGFSSLLCHYLAEANAVTQFGVRVDQLVNCKESSSGSLSSVSSRNGSKNGGSIAAAFAGKSAQPAEIMVKGSCATKHEGRALVQAPFDVIILAVPAAEAAHIAGEMLPASVTDVLRRIEYDNRVAVALVLDHSLVAAVATIFDGAAELTLDLDDQHCGVHLMAWQDAKRTALDGRSVSGVPHGSPVTVVTHSICGADSETAADQAIEALALRLGIACAVLKSMVLHQKVIDWRVSQMTRPLEGLVCDFSLSEPCFAQGSLIVAGDFWTQSSFLGCFCSALAASRAAIAQL
mmetsp:Transcript_85989/g.224169  ORF Transcript_85989/g.224169 Transcript_85989/m.224169 type:complete len:304 (+) Transcript_85989:3-914(+)